MRVLLLKLTLYIETAPAPTTNSLSSMLFEANNAVLFRTKFLGAETIAKQRNFVNFVPEQQSLSGVVAPLIILLMTLFIVSASVTNPPTPTLPEELFCRCHFDMMR